MEMLKGPRHEITINDEAYPKMLRDLPDPPEKLYVIGNPTVLEGGLAIVGPRAATHYGRELTKRFATCAAKEGITIVSGGARGCDAEAHMAALEIGTPTVAVFGAGCNEPYPPEHINLFQKIINKSGAVISEHDWDESPLPYHFRARNRLIAALSKAVLVPEAGLPSGTLTTVDEARDLGRECLAIPGPIDSKYSIGTNYMIYNGATMVLNEKTFLSSLDLIFDEQERNQSRIMEPPSLKQEALHAKAAARELGQNPSRAYLRDGGAR